MPPLSNDPAKPISPIRYRLFKIVSVASTSLAVALGGLAWSLHADKQKAQQGQVFSIKQQEVQDKAAAQKLQELPAAIKEKREKFDSCMAATADRMATSTDFEMEWIEYCLED